MCVLRRAGVLQDGVRVPVWPSVAFIAGSVAEGGVTDCKTLPGSAGDRWKLWRELSIEYIIGTWRAVRVLGGHRESLGNW